MNQLSEEQQERLLTRIRGTLATMRRMEHDDSKAHAYVRDVTKLLTLLDSDSQAAAEGIPDDLPYRIVEAMGLGLTFRSCSCGQLPCARLRPLRDALVTVRRDAATAMRDKCAGAIKLLWTTDRGNDYNGALNDALRAIESLTLDQMKQD